MNIFFLFADGSLVTPPLGSILPGITRESMITLSQEAGKRVREQPYTIEQWRADAGRATSTRRLLAAPPR